MRIVVTPHVARHLTCKPPRRYTRDMNEADILKALRRVAPERDYTFGPIAGLPKGKVLIRWSPTDAEGNRWKDEPFWFEVRPMEPFDRQAWLTRELFERRSERHMLFNSFVVPAVERA